MSLGRGRSLGLNHVSSLSLGLSLGWSHHGRGYCCHLKCHRSGLMSLRCVEMMSDWSTDWFGVCVCSFGGALSRKGSVESTKKKTGLSGGGVGSSWNNSWIESTMSSDRISCVHLLQ